MTFWPNPENLFNCANSGTAAQAVAPYQWLIPACSDGTEWYQVLLCMFRHSWQLMSESKPFARWDAWIIAYPFSTMESDDRIITACGLYSYGLYSRPCQQLSEHCACHMQLLNYLWSVNTHKALTKRIFLRYYLAQKPVQHIVLYFVFCIRCFFSQTVRIKPGKIATNHAFTLNSWCSIVLVILVIRCCQRSFLLEPQSLSCQTAHRTVPTFPIQSVTSLWQTTSSWTSAAGLMQVHFTSPCIS